MVTSFLNLMMTKKKKEGLNSVKLILSLFETQIFSVRARKGFKLNYGRNCGGTKIATEDLGFITSPFYPEPYWKKTECQWLIKAQNTAEKILLEFSHFDLYDGAHTSECKNAHFVQIYEGLHPTVKTQKYCGSNAPPPYVSSGSQLR